jgi:hypothetical protein
MNLNRLKLIAKNKVLTLEFIAVLSAAIILTTMLMIKPVIGIADNGDFGRIMGPTGLENLSSSYSDNYFGYFNREYKTTAPSIYESNYFSTEIFLVNLAKHLNNIVKLNTQLFDIRFLAFIYSCIFLTALFLIIKFNKPKNIIPGIFFAVLLIVVFTDVGYISYFNSLYGEALSFSSLFLAIASIIYLTRQKRPRIITIVMFFIAALLLTGAKAQNVPIGIILSIFSLRLLPLRSDRSWKMIIISFTLLLIITSIKSYNSIPQEMRVCNKYQSVFFGILKDSPTPEADLEELNIDNSLSVLAGTNYFLEKYPINIKNPSLLKEINDSVSPAKVAFFYLKHPLRYLTKLLVTAENGFKLIQGFGNYEKSSNMGYGKVGESFNLWSRFKMNVLPHHLIFIFTVFSFYFGILIFKHMRAGGLSEKIYLEVFMLIGLIGIIQFIVPVVADGEADLSKHLFLFDVCFDIMFVACASWIIYHIFVYFKRLIRKISLNFGEA